MYNPELEGLIDAALADGMLTEKEKQILFKKAQAMGVDLDEFEMVLDARLVKLKKAEQEKAASSAPKSNKLGDVKKCPACGAMVQSYQGACPECGYAFENIDANSSTKRLAKEIDRVMLENNELSKSSSMSYAEFENAKKQRIINAIQNFAIPTTKSDLFEFITSLQAKTKGTYRKAYKNKLEECLLKAQALFPNDKLFVGLIEENKKRKVEKAKKLIYAIGIPVLFAALVVLFFILKPTPTHKSLEKTTIAVDKALKEGDTQKAMTIFFEYKGKGRYRQPERDLAENGTAQSIIDACLADGNLRDAIRIGNAAGMDYGEWDGYEKAMASTIYDYCISHGDFETAKSIYSTANCEFHYHGEYIKDVVTYLCEHGKKDEAQKFLNNNIDKVTSYDHLYESGNGDPKPYVKNIIQKIINHY